MPLFTDAGRPGHTAPAERAWSRGKPARSSARLPVRGPACRHNAREKAGEPSRFSASYPSVARVGTAKLLPRPGRRPWLRGAKNGTPAVTRTGHPASWRSASWWSASWRSASGSARLAGVNNGSHYLAAIDQGTTSSRCIVFDGDGHVVASDQREHQQIFPRPGWVEHDATEIWHNVQAVVRGALDHAGLARADLAAVGITNQRETTLLVGRPDRRTGAQRNRLAGHPDRPADPGTGRRRRAGPIPRPLRNAARDVLFGAEDPLAVGSRSRAATPRGRRRGPVRNDRHVAHLAADR